MSTDTRQWVDLTAWWPRMEKAAEAIEKQKGEFASTKKLH
jgi:hypothetical protein